MWPENQPRPLAGRAPRLQTPPGATDTHMHIYTRRHAGRPGGPPPPAQEATVADYRRIQQWLGLQRVVVVQGNAYQADNACLVEALGELGPCARGVAVVTPETGAAELERLTAAGVRGARIMNLPGGAVGLDRIAAVSERVRPFGWHLIVQFDGRDFLAHEAALTALPGPYVVDHIGKFLEPVPPEHPAFQGLLRLVGRGDVYVKLAAPYETSRRGGPLYEDVGRLARALVAAAPDRLLWGSNWPHVGVPRERYPDDAELLDVLLDWAPDEALRRRILVDNPARLYGF
ncbi:D-galactarolactone isomerase [Tistlia consotensis]|uniref:D-galactarolactone isomerase n=1 Tax=Tistlia consotensis USBA 355 TaxID=560819 RepID=A0A1Y6CSG8_9PROT|nr:amidohydrolase family protein [Tistlia consotensis]SMF76047.1 D-galactarolactone isomerase [Tistlia consotensis USBA 355]SNS12045.1 D-galactarolactone isomerase [Tistlia consotensis]